jgi:hypothetical protein
MASLLVLPNKTDIKRHFKHAGWSRHETHFAPFTPVDLGFVQKVFWVRF